MGAVGASGLEMKMEWKMESYNMMAFLMSVKVPDNIMILNRTTNIGQIWAKK